MSTSPATKNSRALAFLFGFLGFAVSVLPFMCYAIYGFAVSETADKLVLTLGAVAAAIVGLANVIFKKHLRSPLWILLLVLYMVLNEITTLLICAAVGCLLDELVFTPLHNHFAAKATINLEIDKRIG